MDIDYDKRLFSLDIGSLRSLQEELGRQSGSENRAFGNIWTFRNLGKNLTDTVVTRKEHTRRNESAETVLAARCRVLQVGVLRRRLQRLATPMASGSILC